MTKKNMEEKILKLLDKEAIGITITRIAQELDVSRPTVYKYINLLAEDGKVEEIDVGGSKFWTRKTSGILGKMNIIAPYRYIIDVFLETIEKNYLDEVNWKEVGKKMSDSIDELYLLDTEELFDLLIKENIEPFQIKSIIEAPTFFDEPSNIYDLLNKLSPFLHSLFRLIMTFLDDCQIEQPIKVESPPLLIFRYKNFKLLKDNRFLDIFMGIIEKKINTLFMNMIKFNVEYSADFEDKHVNIKLSLSK